MRRPAGRKRSSWRCGPGKECLPTPFRVGPMIPFWPLWSNGAAGTELVLTRRGRLLANEVALRLQAGRR